MRELRETDMLHVEIKMKMGMKSRNGLGGLDMVVMEFHWANF